MARVSRRRPPERPLPFDPKTQPDLILTNSQVFRPDQPVIPAPCPINYVKGGENRCRPSSSLRVPPTPDPDSTGDVLLWRLMRPVTRNARASPRMVVHNPLSLVVTPFLTADDAWSGPILDIITRVQGDTLPRSDLTTRHHVQG